MVVVLDNKQTNKRKSFCDVGIAVQVRILVVNIICAFYFTLILKGCYIVWGTK